MFECYSQEGRLQLSSSAINSPMIINRSYSLVGLTWREITYSYPLRAKVYIADISIPFTLGQEVLAFSLIEGVSLGASPQPYLASTKNVMNARLVASEPPMSGELVVMSRERRSHTDRYGLVLFNELGQISYHSSDHIPSVLGVMESPSISSTASSSFVFRNKAYAMLSPQVSAFLKLQSSADSPLYRFCPAVRKLGDTVYINQIVAGAGSSSGQALQLLFPSYHVILDAKQ